MNLRSCGQISLSGVVIEAQWKRENRIFVVEGNCQRVEQGGSPKAPVDRGYVLCLADEMRE